MVVAVTPNPAEDAYIEVIQLCNNMGGNLLARTELDKLLTVPAILRHATL